MNLCTTPANMPFYRLFLTMLFAWLSLSQANAATDLSASTTAQATALHEAYAQVLIKEDSEETHVQLEQLATRYENLSKSVTPSAHIYYNLGTLYLKLEAYGKAIYYLKSAYQMNSSDVRIADHLQRASRQASVALSPPQQGSFQSWLNGFWENVPSAVWMGGFLLFSLLVTLSSIAKQRLNGVSVILGLISFSILALGLAREQQMGVRQEVVLLNEYNPHAGMGPQYPGIMAGQGLKAGNVGRILRKNSGWFEVLWYDAERGWVPRKEIEVIK